MSILQWLGIAWGSGCVVAVVISIVIVKPWSRGKTRLESDYQYYVLGPGRRFGGDR